MNPENNKQQNTKPEPQIIYVQQKESVRNKGCFGIGCQLFGFSFPLAIIFFIFGLIYLISYRPISLWEPFVNFLNEDIQIREFDGKTYDSAKSEVERQITKVGPNEIFIDENQLTALARKNFNELPSLIADIKSDEVFLYWIADETIEDEPLWAIAKLEPIDDKLVLTRIGTSRITLPSGVSQKLVDNFLSISNFGSSNFNSQDILSELIADKELNIAELDVQQDRLRLLIDVDVSLF